MTTSQPSSSASTALAGRRPSGMALAFVPLAWVCVAVLVLQLVLGVLMMSGVGVGTVHKVLGMMLALVVLVAAIAAFVAGKQAGKMGVLGHVGGMLVLMIVQIALGELGATWPHIILGVLIVIGTFAMVPTAQKTIAAIGA
ncbi:hypothetical protein [Brachybacterium timonense]|uniref:hypothetical protein n=1 Tax=Brachybacterium timonense TaxID=2050896 RepID=UPI00110D94DF|nr:hypothetical protein [Brachybacterium timonense]